MDENQALLREVISKLQLRLRKAESAFDLERDLTGFLEPFQTQFTTQLVEHGVIRRSRFNVFGETFLQGTAHDRSSLIIANVGGAEPFSTLALLMYLSNNGKHKGRIVAVPGAKSPELYNDISKSASKKLSRVVERERIEFAIVIRDGTPYFDAFHLALTTDGPKNIAAEVARHLENLGFQVGKYSVSSDTPSYQVIESKNPLLVLLNTLGVQSLGFSVTERIEACVEALKFLLD